MRSIYSIILLGLLATVITPAAAQISDSEYAGRRDTLAQRVGPGAVIAYGAVEIALSKQGFSQLPSFDYLTGYHHPDAAVIIESDGTRARTSLFITPMPIRKQFYEGFPENRAALSRRTGMATRDLSDLRLVLDSLVLAGVPILEIRDVQSNDSARRDTLTRGRVLSDALQSRHPDLEIADAYPAVWRMRARKSAAEMSLLRRAIAATDSAHRAALAAMRPGVHENAVQAAIEGTFRRIGADGPGFGSIVGSGPNATILHYRAGERRMEAGELVVMDIGAEWGGYVADVTRTAPVSGRFTPEQRAIHDLVLDAQMAAASMVLPGNSSKASRQASERVRLDGLARLGLIVHPDSTYDPMWPEDCSRSQNACAQGNLFMIHGISHGIGLEVHDPAVHYFDGRFAVGDVFTIEPGLYINASALDMLPDTPKNRRFVSAVRDVAERYDQIGVRIEDDYLLTTDGLVHLSSGSPRSAEEIEAAMAAAHK